MPITRLQSVYLGPGEVRASIIAGATSLNVVHPAGCADLSSCGEVPVQPVHLHDQRILPGEIRPVAEVGIWRAFGAEVHVPFRLTHTTIRYSTPDGAPYEPLDPGVHHRNETLAGMGDPWLLGRWHARFGTFLLITRAGVSLPIGRTEENPFARGAAGVRHQHIQFGSGTFDPVIAADLSRSFGLVQATAYVNVQAALYENEQGFRAGKRLLGGLQAGRRIVGGLSGVLGADVAHEGVERWEGRIQQDGNLGRTEILVGGSLMWASGPTSFGLVARFPIWRHIVVGDEPPGTLSSPVMLSAVVSRTFVAR